MSDLGIKGEGRCVCPVYQLCLSDGRAGLDPQVGEGVDTVIFPWTKSAFSEGSLELFLFKPRSQC